MFIFIAPNFSFAAEDFYGSLFSFRGNSKTIETDFLSNPVVRGGVFNTMQYDDFVLNGLIKNLDQKNISQAERNKLERRKNDIVKRYLISVLVSVGANQNDIKDRGLDNYKLAQQVVNRLSCEEAKKTYLASKDFFKSRFSNDINQILSRNRLGFTISRELFDILEPQLRGVILQKCKDGADWLEINLQFYVRRKLLIEQTGERLVKDFYLYKELAEKLEKKKKGLFGISKEEEENLKAFYKVQQNIKMTLQDFNKMREKYEEEADY